MDAKTFGAEMRRARKTLGITQADLAAQVGISRATLIANEQGSGLSVAVAGKIAAVLGLQLQLSPVERSPVERQNSDVPVKAAVPLLGNLRKKRFPRLEEILWTTAGLC